MDSEAMNVLGAQIKTFRTEHGLSQQELSEKSGIERSQLSRIEKGSVTGVTYSTIINVFNALGMTLIPKKISSPRYIQGLHPFVKWAGGKTQLLEIIKQHMPEKFGRYYEPFVGGGALLFKLQPSNFVINDSNSELIAVYNCLCDEESFRLFKEELNKHESLHNEEYYYAIRAMDQNPDFLSLPEYVRAGRMVYLNKACFNGLYRVNSKGFFNVPFGKKEKVICYDRNNMEDLHRFFLESQSKIFSGDFAESVKDAAPGDFIYFDPPYDTWDNKDSFTSYAKDKFDKSAQVRLSEIYCQLAKRGVYVMLSNHNTDFIRSLYKDFHINVVPAKRLINSNASGRGAVEEVIITNYES